MTAINSTMQNLGTAAPGLDLQDVTSADHHTITLDQLISSPLLIMFICNHCPYVIHVINELVLLANEMQSKGFAVVAICANDVETYPQDGPDKMEVFAKKHKFEFPYCYDETQSVATQYQAACTPDFFVYDKDHLLRYRGQMDKSRPGNDEPVTGADLRAAMTAILAGQPVQDEQIPSIGCNIKWKQGKQPAP